MDIGHELRPDAKALFENCEELDESMVNLQDEERFASCAQSVFESVGPYMGERQK